jgi:hypothetical protein
MAIYKNPQSSTSSIKPTNLGVQKNDPQSLIDYISGFNGDRFSFAAGEYDAVKGFFVNKGFAEVSAESISYIILRQARVDNVPVFQIIDQLSKTSTLELNEIIAEILNLNRFKTSVLGFKSSKDSLNQVQRNIKV